MTIPGVDEITAGAIVEEREGQNAGLSGRSRIGGSGKKETSTIGKNASQTGGAQDGTGEEEDYSFKDVGDLISRVPGLASEVSEYVSTSSGTFRLVIEGQAAGITHVIQAIAEVEGDKVRYLRWREDP